MTVVCLLVCSCLLHIAASADSVVTLTHGGQLRGKTFDYDGLEIDVFLGVPYAEPPTGALRFTKPRAAPSWSGVKDALTSGNACTQLDAFTGMLAGDEDCLVLDITVPGGVDSANRKPVMVWFHGGGYTAGSKDIYIGATLAKHGDVIVLTVNYRLDALGFLSDGPGTGNFGLWDQRAALLWVQDNIGKFGGDPDLVTIFGESAGAGSVAAQMIGQHNDGLFKRAIQESGSLFTEWGWYQSERQRQTIVEVIKRQAKCSPSESVYACLRGMSLQDMFTALGEQRVWHPVPDDDFFSPDVVNKSYELSKRFDLLGGFNGQEGIIMTFFVTLFNKTQEPFANGTSRSYVKLALLDLCERITPLSVNLCINFYTKTYGLDSIDDDKGRAIRLSLAMGETSFNVDVVNQLSAHSSSSSKTTYAYHFIENYQAPVKFWPLLPDWIKVSATHTDELPFVFGNVYNKEYNIYSEYLTTNSSSEYLSYLNGATDDDKPLTDLVMTTWTNFAKSGNPNKPVTLPSSIPEWPEYDTVSNQFMELNRTNSGIIITPYKDRLEMLAKNIINAMDSQSAADRADGCSSNKHTETDKDTVIG